MELFLIAVFILAAAAIFDLVVGVSNDAANFLNSSIGSRAAPRYVIMVIASLGILAGVSFSSGMMEVARKGIFHPQLFTMPELIVLFLAVMLADVILLDTFNALGLPTSTTVSIVFELFGAAVVLSLIKIMQAGAGLEQISEYINTSKALLIVSGILLSVVLAFVCGALVQLFTRLLFTHDYLPRLRRYGALWGGVAMASITYFILVKGAKGASFITAETAELIKSNTVTILLLIFAISAILLQILLMLGVNILKPIILIGTFALAMAFAANDLVNFIGVPMAGYHAYQLAGASADPLTASMAGLARKVPSETYLLLLAGAVMVVTLWFSRKARTVSETEVALAHHAERDERFESTPLARAIVRMTLGALGSFARLIPSGLRAKLTQRMTLVDNSQADADEAPSFDFLRASVNLMVASAVISYATSRTLPLSTTYVTFMVAMGTSFADRAWGRESAVYRVTGVLTVIGGWFMTAVMAFMIAGLFALVMYFTQPWGVAVLLAVVGLSLWRNHTRHSARVKSAEADRVFNLVKVADAGESVSATFKHMGYLLQEIRQSLDVALDALFAEDAETLSGERRRVKKVQRWASIITANIFKVLRLLQKESVGTTYRYAQSARRLQKLSDGQRDIVMRAHDHIGNHHKGLLEVQIEELRQVKRILLDVLLDVETMFKERRLSGLEQVNAKNRELRELAQQLNAAQSARIKDGSSKTRLSILFYAITGNALMLSKQNVRLLDAFEESFGETAKEYEFDLD